MHYSKHVKKKQEQKNKTVMVGDRNY